MEDISFGEADNLSGHALTKTLVPSPVIKHIFEANLRTYYSRDIIVVKVVLSIENLTLGPLNRALRCQLKRIVAIIVATYNWLHSRCSPIYPSAMETGRHLYDTFPGP
jgi:hypothetical protein